ncbi:MAG TPA: serine hydrolase domain-containing protein [Nocardioides sp.]|uniref:serine hydrolase domain-containing protein n=1 Tax=Nocardioides sp. TaxID=35761 RepID=UPI002BF1C164|nr:serine hydrolase domain-containing protein [Nocardioides sp.]HQR28270.1 serine hydrolase domain-containing protein [Nocardioides sp.]
MTWSGLADRVADLARADGFSGQVLLRRGDALLVEACFGYAERSHQVPVTAGTRFGVASFTKMFTACTVAGLVAEGRLAFDTPVREVLPTSNAPAWLRPEVTVHHLLSHTSGIADYLEEDELAEREVEIFRPVLRGRPIDGLREVTDFLPLLERVTAHPAPAPLAYSSTGYVLLGLVIEHVTGRPYRSVVTERLLEPLGVRLPFPALDEVHPEVAVGYLPPGRPGAPRRTNVYSLPPVGGPDGGAYLTAAEMVGFLRAYARDEVVPGMRQRLLTPVAADDDGDAYGYGVWLVGSGDTLRIGHTGFDPGFECHGWHWPATDTTLAILANDNFTLQSLYRTLVELVEQPG